MRAAAAVAPRATLGELPVADLAGRRVGAQVARPGAVFRIDRNWQESTSTVNGIKRDDDLERKVPRQK